MDKIIIWENGGQDWLEEYIPKRGDIVTLKGGGEMIVKEIRIDYNEELDEYQLKIVCVNKN